MKGKILLVISLLMVFMPFARIKAEGNNPVKVYMFVAGGCPYCESEEEYLKGLDSYGTKFTLITKELYIDHVDWEKGKDYDLGVKVADEFTAAGFKDASAQGTPFVVISDIYATTGYSTSLESAINQAYEEGDKDIVGCYESGKDNCLDHLKGTTTKKTESSSNSLITIICSIAIIGVYLVKSNMDKNEILAKIK